MNPYLRIKTPIRSDGETWLFTEFTLGTTWPEAWSVEEPAISIQISNEQPIGHSSSTDSAYAEFAVFLGETKLITVSGQKWLEIDDGLFAYTDEVPIIEETAEASQGSRAGLSYLSYDEDFYLRGLSALHHTIYTNYRVSPGLLEKLQEQLEFAFVNWVPPSPSSIDKAIIPFRNVLSDAYVNLSKQGKQPFSFARVCPGSRDLWRYQIRWAYWLFKGFTNDSIIPILAFKLGGSLPELVTDIEIPLAKIKNWCNEGEQTLPVAEGQQEIAKQWTRIEEVLKDQFDSSRELVENEIEMRDYAARKRGEEL